MTRSKVSFIPLFAAAAVFGAPTFAHAGDGDGEASASVSLSGDADADADADADGKKAKKKGKAHPGAASSDKKRSDVPWVKRWAPEARTGEIGVFGGVALISGSHEFYQVDTTLTDSGWRAVNGANADIGIRGGFYPVRHFGVEAEFAAIPMGVPDATSGAFGYGIRAQLVGQIGLWSITPFITAGAGTIAVSSDRAVLGTDSDEVLHIGAGLKAHVHRYLALRLDFRNNFTSERGPDSGGTSHQELLLGLSFTLGRAKNQGPADSDGDGIMNDVDKCPDEPGTAEYEGCPPSDSDGDGVTDDVDQCPNEPGVPEYDGCGVPDSDHDGFADDVDKCPIEKGVAEYEGCPIPDTDGDGIKDDVDKCPNEPETVNGYEDSDGCKDEIPKEIARFTGVIEGIYFDTGKSTIKEGKSKETLTGAIDVLKKFPSLRVEISGHTDNRGKDDENMTLSTARAESVSKYLTEHGVTAGQVETVGWGPWKPVQSNDSRTGRASNRRIEFRLLGNDGHVPSADQIKAEIEKIKAAGGPKPPAKEEDKKAAAKKGDKKPAAKKGK
jgi:outer membrane protein OmpA-like peptidoglycan-associated protein